MKVNWRVSIFSLIVVTPGVMRVASIVPYLNPWTVGQHMVDAILMWTGSMIFQVLFYQ